MAIETRDANGIALTQQEAEAVIELWAKKQADTETLRSRLTVEDMAEAMSLPPSEVEQMLRAVRLQKVVPPESVPMKKVRPVNAFLIAIASAVWIVILVGACFAAYEAGQGDGVRRTAQMWPPAAAPAPVIFDTPPAPTPTLEYAGVNPPAEAVFEISQLGNYFMRGVNVQFGTAGVKGQASSQNPPMMTSGPLQALVNLTSPTPSITTDSELSNLEIVQALRAAKSARDGSFEFRPMTIQLPTGGTVSEAIPISNTKNQRVLTLVNEEQLTRLKILASKAAQKLLP